MRLRILALGGMCALVAPAVLSAQSNPGEAATNWAAIAECATIDAADARHECMDGVARRAGLLSEVRTQRAVRQEFGEEDLVEAPRTPPAPRVVQRPATVPTRAADMQELVTTIASVRNVGYRKLRVTTTEGSVWDQTQAESFSTGPRAGDAFSIVRSALGGFRCQFREASRYQCERVS